MDARTTAVIATRLIGLLLLIYGAAQLLGQIIPLLQFMSWINWDPAVIFPNLSGGDQFGLSPNLAGSAVVALALGWYLLFRGRRVHAWLVAGLGSQCGTCGYNLRGLAGATCPECGANIRRADDRPKE